MRLISNNNIIINKNFINKEEDTQLIEKKDYLSLLPEDVLGIIGKMIINKPQDLVPIRLLAKNHRLYKVINEDRYKNIVQPLFERLSSIEPPNQKSGEVWFATPEGLSNKQALQFYTTWGHLYQENQLKLFFSSQEDLSVNEETDFLNKLKVVFENKTPEVSKFEIGIHRRKRTQVVEGKGTKKIRTVSSSE